MRRAGEALQAEKSECSEKARLLAKYKIAALDYGRVVSVLSERAGVMSEEEYVRIRDYIEVAHVITDRARTMLDRHVAEHGC